MPGFRLHLRTTCVTCGNPIPMSAATRAIVCPTCDTPKTLTSADFRWIMRARPGYPMDASDSSTSGGQRVLLGEARSALVACSACGASLDDRTLEGALAQGGVTCPCGHLVPIRPVPPELDPERWWTAFIGESTVTPVPPATKPVHFTCPHCGAGLMVDGTTRTPDCGYCARRTFLPDDLWNAVRPTPKANPFYLWVDPTWYSRWRYLKGRRAWAAFWTGVLVVFGIAAAFAATALFPWVDSLIGTSDTGGPVPWYERALFTVTFSWMVAWAAGSIVFYRMNPTRTSS